MWGEGRVLGASLALRPSLMWLSLPDTDLDEGEGKLLHSVEDPGWEHSLACVVGHKARERRAHGGDHG